MSGWVRLWHDMPTDPKWRVIARKSGRTIPEVMAVFSFAMVNASANASERGRTHNLFADEIGAALDMETDHVQAIMEAMKGKVLDADGYLTGWEKRQPKREDSSAERAKRWRDERKRTHPNASERPEIEIEIEIDKIEAKASCPAAPNPPPDPVFSEAWKTYPSKGRERSKSQAKTLPIWKDSARRAGGPDRLLAAVKRYVAQDQTHKGECGPPAFDRWLRDGRWEHWLPPDGQTSQSAVVTEISPELRARRLALLNGDTDDQQDHAQASADR